jgi:cephalosporin hydroxylase
MGKLMDVAGKKAMKIMGDTARQAIESFMKAFGEDYEIEYVVADLQLKPNPLQSKGSLQIKMKKKV